LIGCCNTHNNKKHVGFGALNGGNNTSIRLESFFISLDRQEAFGVIEMQDKEETLCLTIRDISSKLIFLFM
jgi:hypothetical protein